VRMLLQLPDLSALTLHADPIDAKKAEVYKAAVSKDRASRLEKIKERRNTLDREIGDIRETIRKKNGLNRGKQVDQSDLEAMRIRQEELNRLKDAEAKIEEEILNDERPGDASWGVLRSEIRKDPMPLKPSRSFTPESAFGKDNKPLNPRDGAAFRVAELIKRRLLTAHNSDRSPGTNAPSEERSQPQPQLYKPDVDDDGKDLSRPADGRSFEETHLYEQEQRLKERAAAEGRQANERAERAKARNQLPPTK